MRSIGERTHVYISIYRDSASVESTRGGSLTLAPIKFGALWGECERSGSLRRATQTRGGGSGALFLQFCSLVGQSGDQESFYNLIAVSDVRKMVIQLD